MSKRSCILFFVKYPTVGQVKSRLAAGIGDKRACWLYRQFVVDLLDMLGSINGDIVICFDPFENVKKYEDWIGKDFRYVEQEGNDIGERMSNSLRQAFDTGYCQAIVIGSDSPDLPAIYIEQAFAQLDNNDAVIGPASDGGYYLIGFNAESFAPEVFEGIAWSSGCEFDETMKVLSAKQDYSTYALDMWHDVDVAGDLDDLLARNKDTEFKNSLSYKNIFDVFGRDA
jgi:rSAM/selenodomain-associated transferase 1